MDVHNKEVRSFNWV